MSSDLIFAVSLASNPNLAAEGLNMRLMVTFQRYLFCRIYVDCSFSPHVWPSIIPPRFVDITFRI